MMILPLVNRLTTEIERLSSMIGASVQLLPEVVLDRSDSVELNIPGKVSANGSCRLVQAKDGWVAINLPRECDREMIPALLEVHMDQVCWHEFGNMFRTRMKCDIVESATLLGMAASFVGETKTISPFPFAHTTDSALRPRRRRSQLRVVDLSSLWAGPLCGAIFTSMGADVLKVECVRRSVSSMRGPSPHYRRLNGNKALLQLDFESADHRRELRDLILKADIVITSARPRAFEQLGIASTDIMARNPGLIWIAITGHGWNAPQSLRIGFGDDAAVSGGLVQYFTDGSPMFLGDAIADPLTGLSAAISGLEAVISGTGAFIDASLASVAAGAAATLAENDTSLISAFPE